MVSSRRKRAPVALTSDLSTSRATRSTIWRRAIAPPAQTSSAASSVKPPAKTESRRKSRRSSPLSRSWLHSIVARRVCWRVRAVRLPAARTSRLSPRRAAICSTERRRDARRGQLDGQRHAVQAPADLLDRRLVVLVGAEARVGGGALDEQAAGLGQRRHAPDDLALAVQRLAAGGHARARPVPARRRSSARRAQASITCSQLSSTTMTSRPARWAASASCAERCAGIGTPSGERGGLGHEPAVAEPGELDEPDPVGRGLGASTASRWPGASCRSRPGRSA